MNISGEEEHVVRNDVEVFGLNQKFGCCSFWDREKRRGSGGSEFWTAD